MRVGVLGGGERMNVAHWRGRDKFLRLRQSAGGVGGRRPDETDQTRWAARSKVLREGQKSGGKRKEVAHLVAHTARGFPYRKKEFVKVRENFCE